MTRLFTRTSALLICLAVTAFLATSLTRPASAAPTLYQASAKQLLIDGIATWSTRSSGTDPFYFQNGLWMNNEASCWRCNTAPGVTAAVLAGRTGDANAKQLAIETMDRAIREHRAANGGFTLTPTSGNNEVETMFFTNGLATALIELGPQLDTTRRTNWTAAVTGAADFLIKNGNLTWYTNGNINIGNALLMANAFKVSGNTKYQQAYETALAFAISPAQDRWPGFGLKYSKVPTRADGSDGAAYFAEKGSNTIGLDLDYVQLQSDFATGIWLVNRDARAMRLMNLLLNQLMTKTNTTTWKIDISGGSRHPGPNQWRILTTAALPTLVEHGRRTDLAPHMSSHWNVFSTDFRNHLAYPTTSVYATFGNAPTLTFRSVTPANQAGKASLSPTTTTAVPTTTTAAPSTTTTEAPTTTAPPASLSDVPETTTTVEPAGSPTESTTTVPATGGCTA